MEKVLTGLLSPEEIRALLANTDPEDIGLEARMIRQLAAALATADEARGEGVTWHRCRCSENCGQIQPGPGFAEADEARGLDPAEDILRNVADLLDAALASARTTADTNPPGVTGPGGQAITTWVNAYNVEMARDRARRIEPLPASVLAAHNADNREG